jgi:hypothetical protein
MALLLLLPLLVSGFLVCLNDPFIYYRLHRYEGQLLYLQVGRYGIYCLVTAFCIMATLSLIFSHHWFNFCFNGCFNGQCGLPDQGNCHVFSTDFLAYLGGLASDVGLVEAKSSQATVFGFLTGLLTLVMPRIWAFRTIRGLKKDIKSDDPEEIDSYLTRATLKYSPMGSTLVNAFAHKQPVMVSMDDRKVYVGLIQSVGSPTEVTGLDLEIKLLPGLSGYRDKDSLKVTYTNTYPKESAIAEPIYFKQENIVSISLFSEKIREVFQKDEAKSTKWYEWPDSSI